MSEPQVSALERIADDLRKLRIIEECKLLSITPAKRRAEELQEAYRRGEGLAFDPGEDYIKLIEDAMRYRGAVEYLEQSSPASQLSPPTA